MGYGNEPSAQSGNYNASRVVTAFDSKPNDVGTVVRDGVTATEQLLSEVHDAISQLEARLETVLTPMPPAGGNTPGTVPTGPPVSHLAGRLAILNDGYRQAAQRLRVLTQRIEV